MRDLRPPSPPSLPSDPLRGEGRLPRPLRAGVRDAALAAFRNRVTKNLRHWSRWARRRDFGAFRFYDRDLPEFPLALDAYVPADPARGALRVHLQEFDTAWAQTPAAHAAWVRTVQATVAEAAGVPLPHVVFKERIRRRAGAQHAKTGVAGEAFEIVEQGLRFWVNLEAYLDTGLFADHRALRALVRSRAAGRRVLNLFGYTGSFTVYAAAGGAPLSDTIDLSNAYLAWAERNFRANGLDTSAHRLTRADAFAWLADAAVRRARYDLIVLDPPAFSNSKAMAGVLDVQRDHRRLVDLCRALLTPGGELYFSTNLRTFVLDSALQPEARDLSRVTRAEDHRDPRVHHAYVFA